MSFAGPWMRGSTAALVMMLGSTFFPDTPSRFSVPPSAVLSARPSAFNLQPSAFPETRALWVLRTSLTSPERIARLVRSAREDGFNTLLLQVRGRGDAYYRGGAEPRAADLERQPASFDPLATAIQSAHTAGLRVHAWVNINLVSSAADLPAARGHLVYRHPSWLMVPRELARDLSRIEPAAPAYLARLARWTRAQSADVEGIYASPILPDAARYTEAIVRDLSRRYAVDGVHFDYVRYPNERFDYSRAAIDEFRRSVRGGLTGEMRSRLDRESIGDVLAYPDRLPDQWRAFRVARMTALMGRLRSAVKAARPAAIVTIAVAPDRRDALDHKLQDWPAWLAEGLVDAVCPMAYTTDPARFAAQIEAAVILTARGAPPPLARASGLEDSPSARAAGSRAVWAGIGAYRLTPAETIENIRIARRLGAAGVVLFSYDSLVDASHAVPNYLSIVGRGAFATAAAAGTGSR